MKSTIHIVLLTALVAVFTFIGCAGHAVRHDRRDYRQDYRYDRRDDRRDARWGY